VTEPEKAPTGLSETAAGWWCRIIENYEDWSPDELLRLEGALQAFDRWAAARVVLDRDGLTVNDRFGQQHAHPLVGIERDSRAACLLALRQLGLTEEAKPVLSRSETARRAAMARWNRGAA
jgi:P27 family predicted phage terminase small subunit